MPQAKIPSLFVWKLLSTTGPPVTGEMVIPAFLESSFSGKRPTERRRVSASKNISVPGMGFFFSSTFDTSIPSTLFFPMIFVTVWERSSGMEKSSRHWTILRLRPEEYGISSTTARTFAPSRVILLAIMRPMSPEPRMTTLLPGIFPWILVKYCAVPALNIPAPLSPGMFSAPLGLSLQPMARTMDLVSITLTPSSWLIYVTECGETERTVVLRRKGIFSFCTISMYL